MNVYTNNNDDISGGMLNQNMNQYVSAFDGANNVSFNNQN